MSMTVSTANIAGVSYQQYGSDYEKSKANNFVNASDRELDRMAARKYRRTHRAEDRAFTRNANLAMKSVPLVAVASSLALKQGGKAALMNGASWALAIAAPAIVSEANAIAIGYSPKLKRFEDKHENLTFAGGLAASVGAFVGGNKVLNKIVEKAPKILENPKVKAMTDKLAESTAKFKDSSIGIYNTVKNKVPEKLSNLKEVMKLENIKKKMPEFKVPGEITNKLATLKNLETTKTAVAFVKNIGKQAIKHAPLLTVLGIGTAVIAKSINSAKEVSNIKSNLKEAQLNTARNLNLAYAEENKSLKEGIVSANIQETDEE